MSLSSTRRGFGSCPRCHHQYSTRWKPKDCAYCGFHLGGKEEHVAKKVRRSCPDAVLLYQSDQENIFSAKTSTRDDRCVVLKEGNSFFCSHHDCKNLRSSFVSSGRTSEFSCKHSSFCMNAENPQETFVVTNEQIDNYNCDSTTKESLRSLISSRGDLPLVVKVSDVSFAVLGYPSTNNTIGYTHVKVTEDTVFCSSKDTECSSFVTKGKYQRAKSLCIHLHALFCSEAQKVDFADKQQHERDPDEERPVDSVTVSKQRISTLQLASRRCVLPVEPQLLRAIDARNFNGWPSSFTPSETLCGLCGHSLGGAIKQPGSDGKAILVTGSGVPFVQVLFLPSVLFRPVRFNPKRRAR